MNVQEQVSQKLHRETGVLDAHCDTVHLFKKNSYCFNSRNLEGHIDLPRLQEGGVKVQFFAVFPGKAYRFSGALKKALELIGHFKEVINDNSQDIIHVETYPQLEKSLAEGKIASLLAIEGGEVLEGSLELLTLFYTLGVRSFGLTWNNRNCLGDGVWEESTRGGLTKFGKAVVKELNRLGMIVDLAHLAEAGFWDALKCSTQPVVISHGNCRRLCEHPRNLNDEQLKGLAENGGVIGISLYPGFIGGNLEKLVDHFDHVASLVGVEHVGIGSDFDGIDNALPEIKDVSFMPVLTEALLNRGFHKEEVQMILKENFLRILQAVLRQGG